MKFPNIPGYIYPLSAIGTFIGGYVLFRDSFDSRYKGNEQITGHTVIVTGANTGIGKETARGLAKRGGRIIMACRDLAKCELARDEIVKETYNANVHCRRLDLASLKSIREFANSINSSEKRVDILINNAGVMYEDRQITEDGFEGHLGTNYLGPFLLTNLLLDKIISSAPARIINVSGIGCNNSSLCFQDFNCEVDYTHEDAYKKSKLALLIFSNELARRLKGTGVTVNTVMPSPTQSSLRRNFAADKSWLSGTFLYPLWMLLFSTPWQGAQTSLYCALEPNLQDKTAEIFSECKKSRMPDKVNEPKQSERLWLTSEKWTRLTDSEKSKRLSTS